MLGGFIFFFNITKKMIEAKIKINSPLVIINKPDIIDKKNIFFNVFFLIVVNNKSRKISDKKTVSVMEES